MQAMQLLLDAGAAVDFAKEGGFVAEGGRVLVIKLEGKFKKIFVHVR